MFLLVQRFFSSNFPFKLCSYINSVIVLVIGHMLILKYTCKKDRALFDRDQGKLVFLVYTKTV